MTPIQGKTLRRLRLDDWAGRKAVLQGQKGLRRMSDEISRGKRRKLDGNGSKECQTHKIGDQQPLDPFSSGYDFLVINALLEEPVFGGVLEQAQKKKNDKLILVVVTPGGLANIAYRIGRFLQSVYEELVVFVPSLCKSAGTLLATSGNELRISPFGEIGPLDVQLPQKDEILGRRSGLTTRTAIFDLRTHAFQLFEHFMLQIVDDSGGAVSFKLAADIAARVTGAAMAKIYEQINPDSLAQDYRDLNVATEYCKRLNEYGKNISETGIEQLVNKYPSHDFVIDLEEAKTLFKRVDLPTPTLYKIMLDNADIMMNPAIRTPVIKMLMPETEGAQHEDTSPEVTGEAGPARTSAEGDGGDAPGTTPQA